MTVAKLDEAIDSLSIDSVGAMLDTHLQLDEAIDTRLQAVMADTESSAAAIIQQMRQLYDAARNLVQILSGTSVKSEGMGADILASMSGLVEIGAFIEKLPTTMKRDLESVKQVADEITTLSELVGEIQTISLQSHMLAINAAIQASHAGSSGAAFQVVAKEMHALASNTKDVATRINKGLTRARHVVEHGIATSITDSSSRLDVVSHASKSIEKLRDSLGYMSEHYQARIATVTRHNEALARDIAEVLGQIQYQDVVRQAIERIRTAITARNDFLQGAVEAAINRDAHFGTLPAQLEMIFSDFVTEEDHHRHSALVAVEGGSEPRIELF
jgi:methyl-accepting chemotaxis protein